MKRIGILMERIADYDNLCLAFYKAAKGKQYKYEVLTYREHLSENLHSLQKQIIENNVSVGKYHYFKIFDPKERTICAAAFDERVLHHAIINVCHEYFESFLIYDTYATRINKGIYKALEKAGSEMKNYEYVAKLDFRKYFDSISHDVLMRKLSQKFKDKTLLSIFYKIIDSYHVKPGFGLPIGNLTSQYFANFYLSELDHFIKRNLKVKVYVRYMDDMLLLSNSKSELKLQLDEIDKMAKACSLTLKPVILIKTVLGVPFLGYKLYPHKILLNRASKLRFKQKLFLYQKLLNRKNFTQSEYQQHIVPLISFAQHAYSKQLRKEILEGSNRVNRGGSWNNNASNCRVANRNNNTPDNRNNNLGFRLALAQKKLPDGLLLNREFSCASLAGTKNERFFNRLKFDSGSVNGCLCDSLEFYFNNSEFLTTKLIQK